MYGAKDSRDVFGAQILNGTFLRDMEIQYLTSNEKTYLLMIAQMKEDLKGLDTKIRINNRKEDVLTEINLNATIKFYENKIEDIYIKIKKLEEK